MTDETPASPPGPRRIAPFLLWGIAIYAGTRLAAILLQATSMAAAVAQAIVAEWGVARLGVVWTDPRMPATGAAMTKRALQGAAIGGGCAAAVTTFLATTHAVVITAASPSASFVVVSLATAGLLAVRDELVLHGVVLRAITAERAPIAGVLACSVTSAAAAIGDASPPRAVLAQGLLGMVFGALWIHDRGAWKAWGAHTAWLFGTDLLLRGGLLEARVASSSWGGADAGPLGGSAVVVALLPFAAGAVVWAARRPREATPSSS